MYYFQAFNREGLKMPRPKNKKAAFVDKKNSVSFHLVHRSQQDPLAADDTAPQMVLQSVASKESKVSKMKEEEREFGVFFEDDYDYMQHLKDRNIVEHDWSEADRYILKSEPTAEKGGSLSLPEASGGRADQREEEEEEEVKPRRLVLPASVFATEGREEEVGLLNKAARTTGLDLSLDPDIVAAMDDDFDFDDPDNELEDDFVVSAMMVKNGEEDDDEEGDEDDMDSDFGGGRSDEEEEDDVPSLRSWSGEETQTKFTNYSMTSSCIRRNNQLTLLDDKFDKFMDQYGDMDEGALEGEEIEGAVEDEGERMQQLVNEAEAIKKKERQQLEREREVVRSMLEERGEGGDDEMEDIVMPVDAAARRRDQWDCESVLSTYSTLYNHPKLISEPRRDKITISAKTGIPKDTLGRGGLTAAALRQLDRETGVSVEDDLVSVRSRMSEVSIRPKHETGEEKRARKGTVKALRRERREEKKANTEAFKVEKSRQEKIRLNLKNNLQGLKIC